jgi:hypothetical protein
MLQRSFKDQLSKSGAIAAISAGTASQSAQAISCPTDRKIVEFSALGDLAACEETSIV